MTKLHELLSLAHDALEIHAQCKGPYPPGSLLGQIEAELPAFRYGAPSDDAPVREWKAYARDLQRWKQEQLQVMEELDIQEIGKEIGLKVGTPISPKVLPWIRQAKHLMRLISATDPAIGNTRESTNFNVAKRKIKEFLRGAPSSIDTNLLDDIIQEAETACRLYNNWYNRDDDGKRPYERFLLILQRARSLK